MHEKKEATKEDIEKNKAVAVISYIPPLFLLPLLAVKDSPYAHFHALQGMVLFIGWVIFSVVIMVPILGWVIGMFGYLFLAIFTIIGIVNAFSGKMTKLPLIGDFADKFNI